MKLRANEGGRVRSGEEVNDRTILVSRQMKSAPKLFIGSDFPDLDMI